MLTTCCGRDYAFGGGRSGESERERGGTWARTMRPGGAETSSVVVLARAAVNAGAHAVSDWHDDRGAPDCWHGDLSGAGITPDAVATSDVPTCPDTALVIPMSAMLGAADALADALADAPADAASRHATPPPRAFN